MERVRFRIEVVRPVAVALYLLAAPVGLVGFLPQTAPVWIPGVLAAMALGLIAAAVIALSPPSVTLLRCTTPAGVVLIALAVASSGGLESPFLELLLLPLVFAAAVFDRRTALPTFVAYVLIRIAVLMTAATPEDLSTPVIATVMELAVAVLISELAERLVNRLEVDRLRTRMSSATTAEELESALAAIVLRDDVTSAAIVRVDATVPTMTQTVGSVGREAAPTATTTRVEPTDSLSRAALVGPVAVVADPHAADAVARAASARGHASQAILPLRPDGVLIGFLVLSSDRRDAFGGRRLSALESRYRSLGEAFGSFLVRRERESRLRTALVGATLSRELTAARELGELLDSAARRMAQLLGASSTVVRKVEPAGPRLLRVVGSSGDATGDGLVESEVEASGVDTVISRREPVFVPDAREGAAVDPALGRRPGAESVLHLPLLTAEGARGCISAAWSEPRMIRQDEIDLATFMAAEVSAAWGRLEAEERLRHQASRDSLTGLLNHAAFHDHVRRALAGLARERRPVALILIDLDHLKYLNDFHGHAAGDAAIRAVADALRTTARDGDVLGRLGGDEFAWLLHGSPDDALTAAHRTVATFAATPVPDVGALSLSAGVAVTAAAMEPEALFELADAALYSAKADGRGTAVLAGRRQDRGLDDDAQLALSAGARDAAAADDVATAARAVVCDWLAAFRVAGCSLSLLTDDGTALRSVAEAWGGGLGTLQPGATSSLAERPTTARAIEDRRTHSCALDDPGADPAEVARLRRLNAGALLLVPLTVGDRTVGVVELFDSRPRRFSGDERRLALALGGYVAVMLDRAVI